MKAKKETKKKICIFTTFDRNYIEAGKTLFNSIRRHTNCTGIDFKVITADKEGKVYSRHRNPNRRN